MFVFRLTCRQYFKPNPYFTDAVLKKEYKYIVPPAAADETPDADGLTPSMLDFSWERDVKPSASILFAPNHLSC